MDSLKDKLQLWSFQNRINCQAFSALLVILCTYFVGLPKDRRTLLHTPRYVPISEISGGDYVALGLQHSLKKHLLYFAYRLKIELQRGGSILYKLHIDGTNLCSSTTSNFGLYFVGYQSHLPQSLFR